MQDQYVREAQGYYFNMMNFPTPHGISFAQGSQAEVRKCYSTSVIKASKKMGDVIMVLECPHEKDTKEVIDPHKIDKDKKTKSVKDFEEIKIDEDDETKVLKIGQCLTREVKTHLMTFLWSNLDVFT